MAGAGGPGEPPASARVELINTFEGRSTVARDRTPYFLTNPFGTRLRVLGKGRRDELVRRGYTAEGGDATAAAGEEPKALADHTVTQLEAIADGLELSKAGPKAALLERIQAAYDAKAAESDEEGDGGDAGDAG